MPLKMKEFDRRLDTNVGSPQLHHTVTKKMAFMFPRAVGVILKNSTAHEK